MPAKQPQTPLPKLLVREQGERFFYEAKFYFQGHQIKRRIGEAWLQSDGAGGSVQRRGRPGPGFLEERTATVEAAKLVESYIAQEAERDRIEAERKARGLTFRELAGMYLRWLEDVHGAKPSTLVSHRALLGEARPYKRGKRMTNAYIMSALGDLAAAKITRRDVEEMLASVAANDAKPATVNRNRSVVSAVFNYGIRQHGLHENPVKFADKRREPKQAPLVFYSPEEIEAVARTLETGGHRNRKDRARTDFEAQEDRQDAEAVRVAAYAGLRQGEMLALRWKDIDWTGSALTVSRALSQGIEGPTKSGHVRRVPINDQTAAALDRISKRYDFTDPDQLVFCNGFGRHLDESALRRRYKRARDRAGMRPLRWHDLRHTFGSTLAAHNVDLVTIKSVMGHADLKTTERYLHAKSEAQMAARFTDAFAPARPNSTRPAGHVVSGLS